MSKQATDHVTEEIRVRRLVVEEIVVLDRHGREAGVWKGYEHGAEIVLRDTTDDGLIGAFVSISSGNDGSEGAAPVNVVLAQDGEWLEIDTRDAARR